jgi:PAS domain S-box-containing protein
VAVETDQPGTPGPPWAALVETLPAACYIDRLDGTSVWVSEQIEAIVGCTPDEWASGYGAWSARIHPDDRDRVLARNEEFVRTGGPPSDEYRVVLPDGRVRWVHERSLLLRTEPGEEPLVHGVVVDVTDERTSYEIAERAGRLFRALVEHSGEGVTIVNEQGVVVYQNPTMGKVVGRPPEWFEGRTPLDLMPPEDAARARDILAALRDRPGAQIPGEFRLRHRNGSWRTVSGLATNLLNEPAVRGIVLNYRDVTEERDMTRRLREAEGRRQALLESMVRAEDEERSRIAAELHDDTIQVMTAALLDLDRSERHLRQGEVGAARDAIAGARSAIADATERTRRLTFELRPQLLEAAGLSAAIRDLAAGLARDTGVEVSVRTRSRRYPAEVESLVYRTMREALINVRKHAHAGHVAIRLGERGGALYGRVTDDGRGFRTTRPRGRRELQIGLETARERLRAAGGSLDVTSAPGEGTTFEFRIPLPEERRHQVPQAP